MAMTVSQVPCGSCLYMSAKRHVLPSLQQSRVIRRCLLSPTCSLPQPPQSEDGDLANVDWDRAWTAFKGMEKMKRGGLRVPPLFASMEKYVTRSPTPSNFPIDEEVDPLRRLEKSALRVWTDPKFTVMGFGLVALLLVMMVIVGPPPM